MNNPPFNPYAPPTAQPPHHPAASAAAGGVWQAEGVAVCAKHAPWPDRCVRCNEPAQGYRLKRDLYWHEPWVYFLILAGAIVYVIVALILRKTATIHVGLCPKHRASRRNWILLGWLGALASIGTCTATVKGQPEVIGLGFLGVLVFAVVGIIKARTVTPKKIDETHAWIRCDPSFVSSLPPLHRPGGGYSP